ncbi:serine hydrolase [Streptomyces rishiriensis]|uniref:serine hydrolase n=1 Tax=Streptomyces rishiriensis TaxID=68264 RepID=UPI0033E6CDD8
MSLVESRTDLTAAQFEAAYKDLAKMRLIDLCGYESNGQALFSAIWEPSRASDPIHDYIYYYAMDPTDYFLSNDEWIVQGYRPLRVNGYSVGEKTFIATIWARGTGADNSTNISHPNILNLPQHLREIRAQGNRIVDINCYATYEPNPDYMGPGPAPLVWVTRFATIWTRSDGRDWAVSLPADSATYQTIFDSEVGIGRIPVRVSGFNRSGTQKFVALFEGISGIDWGARHGRSPVDYAADRLQLENIENFRPTVVGGYSVGHGAGAVQRFNPIWVRRDSNAVIPGLVNNFLRDFKVAGLSLAVAKDGRLVYADGFGLADKASSTKVTSSSLFRIASVSKPITAVAMLKLLADRRIDPEELRVFGPGNVLSRLGTPLDSRASKITVRHLLEHSCGGWADNPDPMFTKPALSARQLITDVLTHRSLDNAPGTAFAYSNFGYCVLGRVIEEISGQTYEQYVRQHVLLPCGVENMFIAGNTAANKRPGEVTYYGLDGNNPYDIPISRMDAHGGWLGTPTDLLRFAVRADGFPAPPDILQGRQIAYMTYPSGLPNSNGYAKGWYVEPTGHTWYHYGVLAGTAAFLARTKDGYCVSAVTNSGPTVPSVANGLDNLMWKIHDRVDVWLLDGSL